MDLKTNIYESKETKPTNIIDRIYNKNETNSEEISDDGLWVGIDLGTTNCVCAVWDKKKKSAKVFKLSSNEDLGMDMSLDSCKFLIPSVFSFSTSPSNNDEEEDFVMISNNSGSDQEGLTTSLTSDDEYVNATEFSSLGSIESAESRRVRVKVGQAALKESQSHDNNDSVLISSVKRILGLTYSDLEYLKEKEGGGFVSSLPFSIINFTENDSGAQEEKCEDKKELYISISRNKDKDTSAKSVGIQAVDATYILLKRIKQTIEYTLKNHRKYKFLEPPGLSTSENTNNEIDIKHAVIGVPAHYSQTQKQKIIYAARQAGFSGNVSTIIESTAACMSYGLSFMDTTTKTENLSPNQKIEKETMKKWILVFDMGGGTTDVTIGTIENNTNNQENSASKQFQVKSTNGEFHLGGDDMDRLIYDYTLEQIQSSASDFTIEVKDVFSLVDRCKVAKENLCTKLKEKEEELQLLQRKKQRMRQDKYGIQKQDENYEDGIINDDYHSNIQVEIDVADLIQVTEKKTNTIVEDIPSKHKTKISLSGSQLDQILKPITQRAKQVIESALDQLRITNSGSSRINTIIDEVILVGGSSRVPSIYKMIQSEIFPHIKEFCTSIHPMKAVAQGCAIQSAILSKEVDMHEIRDIYMMDALPHSIGLLLPPSESSDVTSPSEQHQQQSRKYVEILPKNTPLPAMGYQSFQLSSLAQKGITVHAVENIGPASVSSPSTTTQHQYQPLGEFNFLLHKLTKKQQDNLDDNGEQRWIDVGMTLSKDGQFVVSIFDSNDPEHIAKKKRHQEFRQKVMDEKNNEKEQFSSEVVVADEETENKISKEEVLLGIACIFLFALYIFAKISFAENMNSFEGDDETQQHDDPLHHYQGSNQNDEFEF